MLLISISLLIKLVIYYNLSKDSGYDHAHLLVLLDHFFEFVLENLV